MKTLLLGLALVFGGAIMARADVELAPLFSDHAVLQRDKPVTVWGRAEANEHVTVTFLGQTVAAVAAGDGKWVAVLPASPANATGSDLVVAGKNTLTLHDVVVGEVWLCSGQSNMEFVVANPPGATFRVQNADAEVAAARYPLIRQFLVARQVAEKPLDTASGSWALCSPETVSRFTAVGYFFARDLHRRLDVPVGIIDSTWGGTPIEAWMSPAALASDPAFAVVGERWKQALAEYPKKLPKYRAALAAWTKGDAAFQKSHPKPRAPRGPGDPSMPAGLFDGMINPLLPYALRGALWYQGEANASRASEYHRLFAAMITAWREHFGQGDFPFYWVQLANYAPPGDLTGATWAFLREAQTQTLSLPETGQAVTIDIGEPNNIHPRNKQEVGRRLALIAKAKVYGIPGDFSGPVMTGAVNEGAAMRVRFRYADDGLTAGGTPLQSFELAGVDRKFYPAAAAIDGNTVVVRSTAVPSPVAVRYAWHNIPVANLFNGAGLPAVPFRSDHW